jgi:hypothetical protein
MRWVTDEVLRGRKPDATSFWRPRRALWDVTFPFRGLGVLELSHAKELVVIQFCRCSGTIPELSSWFPLCV